MPPALIVGLGNPGPEYALTRHNVGFEVVETIAARSGDRLRPAKGIPALVASARDDDRQLILVEPTTFMNLSGEAVAACMRYWKAGVDDVVIVHDDVDLPFGDLRVKRGGGDGGHNGLKHVTRSLSSNAYARVRMGIGRPSGRQDVADFVLSRFTPDEREQMDVLVQRAADAALSIVRAGVDQTHRELHGEAPGAKARRIQTRRKVAGPPEDLAARLNLPVGAEVDDDDLPRRLSLVVATTPEPTRANVRLRRAGSATVVEVTHSGWGEGDLWRAAREGWALTWATWLDALTQPEG